MRRGTNPVLTFELPEAITISALYITFQQNRQTVLEKDLTAVTYDKENGIITLPLSQEDTLLFSELEPVWVQLRLRDNLDKVREVIRNVFGDAGVEVFDKIVTAISNIGSTIQSIFTDGNLGGARDFLINLFGEEATGVIDGAITVLQTVWNILSGFIEFVNTYVLSLIHI